MYQLQEPQDQGQLLLNLAQDVFLINLQQGISNSLDAKLDSALQSLADINENNDIATVNSLQAFINSVEAQSGKKIPEADADHLIAAAQRIIYLLNPNYLTNKKLRMGRGGIEPPTHGFSVRCSTD